MTNLPPDEPRTFRRKPLTSSIKVVAKVARVALGLRDEEEAFELPARLFEQLPFAVYVCNRDGLVLRYNRRAAELWGGRLSSAIPMNGFAVLIECSGPTAVGSCTMNAPWPTCCAPVFPCVNRKSTSSDRTACAALRSSTSRQSRMAMGTSSAPSTASRI